MSTWKGIVRASFTPATFDQYCHLLHWTQWRARFVALHNTEIPTLKQRPNGLSHQHVLGLEKYYRDAKGCKAGPHLFVDDRQIWVFTPLTVSGVHVLCFNKVALGVEMPVNYDQDAFDRGRGVLVSDNAVAALATLHAVLGLESESLKLHKEDTCSTHRHYLGLNVHKAAVIQAVQGLLQERHPGGCLPPPPAGAIRIVLVAVDFPI